VAKAVADRAVADRAAADAAVIAGAIVALAEMIVADEAATVVAIEAPEDHGNLHRSAGPKTGIESGRPHWSPAFPFADRDSPVQVDLRRKIA
jgi:hypothetical protein